jgi:hypothetical protein
VDEKTRTERSSVAATYTDIGDAGTGVGAGGRFCMCGGAGRSGMSRELAAAAMVAAEGDTTAEAGEGEATTTCSRRWKLRWQPHAAQSRTAGASPGETKEQPIPRAVRAWLLLTPATGVAA